MENIVVCKENLKGLEVSLSTPRKANGKNGEFTFYWATLMTKNATYICCTSQAITAVIEAQEGEDGDEKLLKAIVANEGKWEICQAEEEDEEGHNVPIYLPNGKPLLQLKVRAHRRATGW